MSIIDQIEAAASRLEAARNLLQRQIESLPTDGTMWKQLDEIDAILFDVWVALGN